MHGKTPGIRHNQLLETLRGVTSQFTDLPVVERVAVAAQFVGQLVRDVPDGPYTKDEILRSVLSNMAAGNAVGEAPPAPLPGLPS